VGTGTPELELVLEDDSELLDALELDVLELELDVLELDELELELEELTHGT
jgi:hypothetical protein